MSTKPVSTESAKSISERCDREVLAGDQEVEGQEETPEDEEEAGDPETPRATSEAEQPQLEEPQATDDDLFGESPAAE